MASVVLRWVTAIRLGTLGILAADDDECKFFDTGDYGALVEHAFHLCKDVANPAVNANSEETGTRPLGKTRP